MYYVMDILRLPPNARRTGTSKTRLKGFCLVGEGISSVSPFQAGYPDPEN